MTKIRQLRHVFAADDDDDPPVITALWSLLDHLEHNSPMDEGDARMIADGLRKYLQGGGRAGLEQALGLRRRGGVSIGRELRLARRDEQLVHLWRTCERFRDLPPLAAAKAIAIEAKRYEFGRWKREQDGDPPSSEPAATFFEILWGGAPLPGAKRLQQILEKG